MRNLHMAPDSALCSLDDQDNRNYYFYAIIHISMNEGKSSLELAYIVKL